MDGSRLGTGETIAGVSGVVLLIVLFLPWYGVDLNVAGFSASESVNAWEALGFIDILLFLVALVAIGMALARASGSLPDDFPGPLALVAAGALGLVLVLFRLIDIPAPDVVAIPGDSIDFGRKFGLFLGLIATAGITYGGLRANAEQAAGTTSSAASPPEPSTPA